MLDGYLSVRGDELVIDIRRCLFCIIRAGGSL